MKTCMSVQRNGIILSIIRVQAEQRADLAERTMAKLQKEVDRLEGNTR